MGRAIAAPRDGAPQPARPARDAAARRERAVLLGVLVAEAALVAWAGLAGGFLAAAALAAACVFLLVVLRAPDLAWALIWLAAPFSVERVLPGRLALYVPTEPMLAIALLGFAVRFLATGPVRVPASPLHRPLAVVAAVALLSAVVSPGPLTGIKYWLASAAYASFGYLYLLLTPCSPARRERWIRLASIAGAAWGAYGAVRILLMGVSAQHGYWIARPFFTEHGTYAAYLALVLPVPLVAALERHRTERLLYSIATLLVVLGLTLSFTRAAWLSIALVLPLMCALWAAWRGRARRLIVPALLVAAVAVVVGGIGAGARLSRHAESIASVENVSNLERLNRWSAALSMARDRPWLGVGLGRYEDEYRVYRGRRIVTEQSFQRMGAHSEPLRLLSETGVAGLLAAAWFLGAVLWLGLRVFRNAGDDGNRALALALVSGLATYVVHGLFNAYLGIDKVSVPFWLSIGAIAALARSEAIRR